MSISDFSLKELSVLEVVATTFKNEVHCLINGTNNWFGTRVVSKISGLDILENPYADMKPETAKGGRHLCRCFGKVPASMVYSGNNT